MFSMSEKAAEERSLLQEGQWRRRTMPTLANEQLHITGSRAGAGTSDSSVNQTNRGVEQDHGE
jgi:hypothetical protein